MQTTAVPNAHHLRTERILAHTALAKGIALRLAGRVPKSVELDDLVAAGMLGLIDAADRLDRKSTRLNSSHLVISYAVFCLKKKKNIGTTRRTLTRSSLHPTLPPLRSQS